MTPTGEALVSWGFLCALWTGLLSARTGPPPSAGGWGARARRTDPMLTVEGLPLARLHSAHAPSAPAQEPRFSPDSE